MSEINEKKPTARRTRTTAPKAPKEVVEKKVVTEELEDGVVIIEETAPTKVEPLTEDTKIEIVCNTFGAYGYFGNGYSLRLSKAGLTAFIPMSRLRDIFNSQSKHITEGWIVIKDERAIEDLNLSYPYEAIFDHGEMDYALMHDMDKIEKLYPRMSKHMKALVLNRAKILYKQNRIKDIGTVQVLQALTGKNIMSL